MKRVIMSLSCALALATQGVWAQTRTQTIPLVKGWNAVWLEVQPTNSALAAVFAGVPADIVAAYTLPVSEAQFVQNTAVNVQTLAGWNVWYAPYRADAPLTQLTRVGANTGYLIHALDDAVLAVRGEVPGEAAVRWTPGRFNLVGFPVADPGGPTFKQFFSGSPAHNHTKIYRLADGAWRQVLAPDSETLRSGEAFWIYCDGTSDYQGPLSVKVNSVAGLVLAGALKGEIEFRNATTHPLGFSLEQVLADGAAGLPLAAVVKVAVSNHVGLAEAPVDFPDGAWTQAFPEYDAGKGVTLPFALRVKDIQPGQHTGLLKVTTDLGTETWVPVRASRE